MFLSHLSLHNPQEADSVSTTKSFNFVIVKTAVSLIRA